MEFTGERMIPELSRPNNFWEHVYRYKFALRFISNKDVLDIASGEGYGTAALAAAGANNVIGIDISEEACEHARRKYGLDYRVGNAEVIPLDDKSIDAIVSFETIEHLDNPEIFLRECARILKPRGELILSTPNLNASTVYKDNEFHKILFGVNEMNLLLKEHFDKVKIFCQCPESASLLSSRFLAASRSSLRRFNSYKKFISKLRIHFVGDVFKTERIDYYRNRPIEAILKRNHFFEAPLNPYFVSKCRSIEKESPAFFIFLAKKKKQK